MAQLLVVRRPDRAMQKIRFIIFLLLTAMSAVAVWFWAFLPIFTPFIYLRPTGFGPRPSIWYSRLVQPQWVSTPPDYSGWSQVETSVRVAVIVICWIVGMAFIEWLFPKRQKEPPNQSPEPTAVAAAVASHAASRRWLSFFR